MNATSHPLTAKGLANAYRDGSTSPGRVVVSVLERIGKLNPVLNCFITVLEDEAMRSARESEARFAAGKPLGPLDGVPVAVKDVIYIRGVRCTAGSKILATNVAPYDSPVTRRLRNAGAILIGTTNLHEFASGVTNVNPHYGPVRNPWSLERISGGSSGGSAAAVASGMAAVGIGTDTAGSVRIPAALCGTVGLKPTYGRISRLGVVPLASSFDTVGTLSTCAWDSAALLGCLAGHEPEDLTTVDTPVPDYVADLHRSSSGARIGVPRSFFQDLVDAGVERVASTFVGRLEKLGCETKEMELDGIGESSACFFPIRRGEATAFHLKWLDSAPNLYGEDVRKLLELGRQTTAVEYVSAQNARPGLMQRFVSSMANFDAVVLPTTSVAAPLIGDQSVRVSGRSVDVYSAMNRLTLPFNVVGLPSLSVPAGFADGLPVGMQLVAKPFEESKILALANSYEEKFGAFPLPPLEAGVAGAMGNNHSSGHPK